MSTCMLEQERKRVSEREEIESRAEQSFYGGNKAMEQGGGLGEERFSPWQEFYYEHACIHRNVRDASLATPAPDCLPACRARLPPCWTLSHPHCQKNTKLTRNQSKKETVSHAIVADLRWSLIWILRKKHLNGMKSALIIEQKVNKIHHMLPICFKHTLLHKFSVFGLMKVNSSLLIVCAWVNFVVVT